MTADTSIRPTGPETVAEWRLQVLQKVFTYMFLLLVAIFLGETVLSLRSGQWHGLPSLAGAIVLQGIAAFATRWSVQARACVFTAASWVGVGLILPVLGFGFPIPFVMAGLTLTLLALCVSERFAFISLLTLVAVVLVDGSYFCFLHEPQPLAALGERQRILDPNLFPNWIRVTSVFAAVGVATIFSIGFLVRRLEEAVHRNGRLFGSLEQVSRDKIRALEEREILQDKVRRSNELQLLGLLSATVAHDFNNLLMVIMGNASALKSHIPSEYKEDIADIERAGEQAADLCRRLLTLAGERISGDEILELNQLIEAELPILRRMVSSRVKVEWSPGPPLWLKCARTEMRQALLNLCANARDAMPEGGRLRIATTQVERSRPGSEETHDFAALTISDTGVGMDAVIRQRIFEPFFTTKGKAKGTGLGMAVVSAAVERNQGFLELESELGKGTTFTLFFPVIEAPVEQPLPHMPSERKLAGRETVLVVDDDEGARKMLCRYLQRHGYHLLTANDGQEALELLNRTPKVDLIISDAVMPRMSGRALFEAISKARPQLPFLFCSGFPAGAISDDFLRSPHHAVLPKPFSEETLLRKVRQLLDGQPAQPTV